MKLLKVLIGILIAISSISTFAKNSEEEIDQILVKCPWYEKLEGHLVNHYLNGEQITPTDSMIKRHIRMSIAWYFEYYKMYSSDVPTDWCKEDKEIFGDCYRGSSYQNFELLMVIKEAKAQKRMEYLTPYNIVTIDNAYPYRW